MRISDWSSDVCSSDLGSNRFGRPLRNVSKYANPAQHVRCDGVSGQGVTGDANCYVSGARHVWQHYRVKVLKPSFVTSTPSARSFSRLEASDHKSNSRPKIGRAHV